MVEYLDPEIANEGVSAEQAWMPAMDEARIPSYAGIKSIKKYFPQFTGRPYQHQAYPCWLYHPTEPPRHVKDVLSGEDPPRVLRKASEIAKELGCVFRSTTMEERAQGFANHRWEYIGEWRSTPFERDSKFDPGRPDTGKHVIRESGHNNGMPNADVIAAIVGAVMTQVKSDAPASVASTAHAGMDPEWLEFQAFKEWKAAVAATHGPSGGDEPANALSATLSDADERKLWEDEAKAKGVKTDGRWSLDRLKAEVEKAS